MSFVHVTWIQAFVQQPEAFCLDEWDQQVYVHHHKCRLALPPEQRQFLSSGATVVWHVMCSNESWLFIFTLNDYHVPVPWEEE